MAPESIHPTVHPAVYSTASACAPRRSPRSAMRFAGLLVTGLLLTSLLSSACGGPKASPVPGGSDARSVDEAPQARFTDIAAESGLRFTHANGMTGRRSFVEMMGSGGGWLDYDNDGDLDAYLVQGAPVGEGATSAVPPGGRLFRNDAERQADGSLAPHFSDVTEASGIRSLAYGMGLATGDYDNDGWTDLYLTHWGANQLYRNRGDGSFEEVTAQAGAGLDDGRWSTASSFVDYDRDGWLDLLVVNYVDYRLENDHPCFAATTGRPDYCGPASYKPAADRLFHNRADGSFEEVTLPMGLGARDASGLGSAVLDVNGDGYPDLFVANDAMENDLWVNLAGEGFENQGPMSGTALNRQGVAEANMGIVAADLDGDADEDLFVTHLKGETNTLYLNGGQGLFEDRTRDSGLGAPSLPMTAFGAGALDHDLDGDLDLLVANGEVRVIDEQDAAGDPLPLRQSLQLFTNLGEGRFADHSRAAGPAFQDLDIGRAVAVGDVDNDGDPDALVTFNNGPARLLRNDRSGAACWLGLRLLGAGGRDMLGAQARLTGDQPAGGDGASTQLRRVQTDASYLSAQDPRLIFACVAEGPQSVEVLWPDGRREGFADLPPGRYHTLTQGQGQAVTGP
ncbi:MAG: CRTAC1 family protein [Ardenticatenia bacterium]|nr:CRTAC1 family protein [Ardenticatenia bacterium]